MVHLLDARPAATDAARGADPVLLRVFRIFVLASTLVLTVACAPDPRASADTLLTGSVHDADTGEPIEGAFVFETFDARRAAADVPRVDRARETRSDADGAFRFDSAERGFDLGSLGRDASPRYQVYHPSYGLVRGRAAPDGHVRFRLSLRDAHLRQADARAFCTAKRRDPMTEKLVALACPPARPDLFDDGSPRATGPRDDRGRRNGTWTFYREDGSVIARGDYQSGAAVRDWQFYSREDRAS